MQNKKHKIFTGLLAIYQLETVPSGPKKVETAVHGCNHVLSVSVVFVSRKVNFNHVVSALHAF